MAGKVLSRSIIRQNDWTTLYIIVVAMGLTMLGLVMLFSAGVAKDAHSLLTKQVVWVGLSVFIAIYFSVLNLDWLKDKTWIIFGLCILGLDFNIDAWCRYKGKWGTAVDRSRPDEGTTI